ncbi:hypothetical protein [Catenovulum agarivorans]|uniref:hypothetical protein n=1 Tax=Catenovulum agarivorans TaxID=1172192 RepID=UPI0002ED08FB|nr:hypothetical protein [Catenovulum agarivorans]
MRKTLLGLTCLTVISPSVYAFNLAKICESGTYHRISGNIQTKNISETEQEGTILLNLYKVKGFKKKKVASTNGSISGQITNQNGFSITLNHNITLENGLGEVYTHNDQAYVTGVTEFAKDDSGKLLLDPSTNLPTPCGFTVIEQIMDISGSTGLFKNATGKLTAFGTINMCPQNIQNAVDNQFSITGYTCLEN